MQSKYTNITIFYVSKRFCTVKCVRLLLDVVYFLCFAIVYRPLPYKIQRKMKGRRAHILEKGPGTKFSQRTPPGLMYSFLVGESLLRLTAAAKLMLVVGRGLNQVILARTLTGVQGEIRCKGLAAISTTK